MNYKIKLLTLLSIIIVLFSSCEYQEVADADYPDQIIYMPTAVNGIYTIDKLPEDPEYVPTPGFAYRFLVDETNNKFIVPLGVYRSGLDRKSDIPVDLTVQNDTINNLMQAAVIPASTIVLNSDKYSLPSNVVIEDGSEICKFNLEIDLNYLKSIPNEVVALSVNISSSEAEISKEYPLTVIVVHTKILSQ